MSRVYKVEQIEGKCRFRQSVEADFSRIQVAFAIEVVAEHGNHSVVGVLRFDFFKRIRRSEIPIGHLVGATPYPHVFCLKIRK